MDVFTNFRGATSPNKKTTHHHVGFPEKWDSLGWTGIPTFQPITKSTYLLVDGGFRYFLFSLLLGEDFQLDTYFSTGLKPPTSYAFPPNFLRGSHHFTRVASQDAKIDASEFLQIQLLRTGKVDRETLEIGGGVVFFGGGKDADKGLGEFQVLGELDPNG